MRESGLCCLLLAGGVPLTHVTPLGDDPSVHRSRCGAVIFSPARPDMSQHRPQGRTPKVTPEQAEAYRRGTPAARRASVIMILVIWVAVIGAALLLAFVFHKTLHSEVFRI